MEAKGRVPIGAKLKMTITRKDGSVEVIEPETKIAVKENTNGNDSGTD